MENMLLRHHDAPSLISLPAFLHRQNFCSERPPDRTQPVLIRGVRRRANVPPFEPDPVYGGNDRGSADAEDFEQGIVGGPADEVVHGKGPLGGVELRPRGRDSCVEVTVRGEREARRTCDAG